MCDIAVASDLLEFEVTDCTNHCQALLWAINCGEYRLPLTPDFIREIHARMFPRWAWAGRWRANPAAIGGADFVPTNPLFIDYAIREFCDTVAWHVAHSDPYVALAASHLEFERIHPLEDGNGRVGRALINYLAAYLRLPLIKLLPEDREHYLDLLAARNISGLAELFEARHV